MVAVQKSLLLLLRVYIILFVCFQTEWTPWGSENFGKNGSEKQNCQGGAAYFHEWLLMRSRPAVINNGPFRSEGPFSLWNGIFFCFRWNIYLRVTFLPKCLCRWILKGRMKDSFTCSKFFAGGNWGDSFLTPSRIDENSRVVTLKCITLEKSKNRSRAQ